MNPEAKPAKSVDQNEDILKHQLPPPPAETASRASADEAKAMDEAAEILDEEVKTLAPWLWIVGLLLILAGLLLAVWM